MVLFNGVVLASMWILGAIAAPVPQGDAPVPSPGKAPRPMRPTEPEVAAARATVDGVFTFGKRMAARDREEARTLANDLLAEVRNRGANKPPVVFAMLAMAVEAAERVGDVAIVQAATAEMEARFLVDGAIEAFEAARRMARDPQGVSKAVDLVRLFATAGAGAATISPPTASRALEEAQKQAKRCAGNRDDQAAAQAALRELEEAIRHARVAKDRLGPGETLERVAVPAHNHVDRAKARVLMQATHLDLDTKSKRELETLQAADFDEGAATRKHPPGVRYEYLVTACDLATRTGDTAAIAAVVRELEAQFVVNGPEVLLAAALAAVGRRVAPAENLVRLLLDAARGLLPTDLVQARRALDEAKKQRDRHKGNLQLFAALGDECARVQAEIDDTEAIDTLRRALASNANDRKAAERLGWILCIRREDWAQGLPLLARSEGMQLQSGVLVSVIATKELAKDVGDEDAWQIAEAWWGYAEAATCPPHEREPIRRHARSWYKRLGGIQDLRRRKIDACLREDAPTPLAPATAPEKGGSESKDAATPPKSSGAAAVPPRAVDDAASKEPDAAAALAAGQAWLLRHQSPDGRWDCAGFMKLDPPADRCDGAGAASNDIGVTGLALLALLGSNGAGLRGPHAAAITHGLEWLVSQQTPEGMFGTPGSSATYCHAIATIAMARAAKIDAGRWSVHTRSAAAWLVANKTSLGWRYEKAAGDSDLSVTAWCVAACTAAKEVGYEFPETMWREIATFLDSVTDAQGWHGYTAKGEPSARKPGEHSANFPPEKGEALTAAGLYSRLLLGQRPAQTPVLAAAAALVAAKPPNPTPSARDHYYWYLGTQALKRFGGNPLGKWRGSLRLAVLQHQQKGGSVGGSWDPIDVWGEDGGRVAATALLCITLQVAFLDPDAR